MSRKSKMLRRVRAMTLIIVGSSTLSACGAARAHLRYGSLSTNTRTSESVFLELRNDRPMTVYVHENSMIDADVSVAAAVARTIQSSGYTVVSTPDEATYLVQLNHRQLIETELGEGETLSDAIGNAWMAGAGASLATEVFTDSDAAGELGVLVGVAAFILDAKTKHLAHTLTTDVLITEVIEGPSGIESRYHETQVVSGASKVNLGRSEALPALVAGTSSSVTRLLGPAGSEAPRVPGPRR